MKDKDSWVIDGNYSKIVPERFIEANLTIFLNYNRFYCYKMARRRYNEFKGRSRESCPCDEKFDWEFKKWILFVGRTKSRRQSHINNLNKGIGKKIIFKNKKALDKWINSLAMNRN